MRRKVDATEMDAVYLDPADAETAEPQPPAQPAAPAAAAPAAAVPLVGEKPAAAADKASQPPQA